MSVVSLPCERIQDTDDWLSFCLNGLSEARFFPLECVRMEPDHDWIHPAERDYSDLKHPELFQEKAEIRNKDIPIRMKERSDHQQ